MVDKINFDAADKAGNKNGILDPEEFEKALVEFVKKFDINHDGYISNGSGLFENGVDEFTPAFYETVPFERGRLHNESGNCCYSFNYYSNQFAAFAWEKIGGRVKIQEYAGWPSNLVSRNLEGAVTKEDIRKSGVTFIDLGDDASTPPVSDTASPSPYSVPVTSSSAEQLKSLFDAKPIDPYKNFNEAVATLKALQNNSSNANKVWTFPLSTSETLTPFQQYMEDHHPLLADYFNLQMSDAQVTYFTSRKDIQNLMTEGTDEAYEAFAQNLADATNKRDLLNKKRPLKK